jgi:diguanylate cyclase (GGDEF)-like protein
MSRTAPGSPLAKLALGPAGHQRVRVSQALLALAVYALYALVQHAEVLLGLLDLRQSNWLTAFDLAGALGFYLCVRSGLSRRLSKDPSLTLAQGGFALCAITWSYAITGPARGAVLSILVLVILFGMFSLSRRQARALALAGLLMLAGVMIWRAATEPQRYEPRVEVIHFLFTVMVTVASTKLSIRLGRLRSRLSAQKEELERALELNRHLATCDALTGLPNRRAMAALLAREQPPARTGSGSKALAILDIDWFKRINDTFGHHTGDEVLRRFAELARIELRAGDVLARWGGEEFLLLMPNTRRDHAHAALDRMRVRVAEGGFDGLVDGLAVSFSAGITECAPGEPYATALERADQALYQAKNAGRNRIQWA